MAGDRCPVTKCCGCVASIIEGEIWMTKRELLLNNIESLRESLIKLIDKIKDLQHPEIISASHALNQSIAEYHRSTMNK